MLYGTLAPRGSCNLHGQGKCFEEFNLKNTLKQFFLWLSKINKEKKNHNQALRKHEEFQQKGNLLGDQEGAGNKLVKMESLF